MLFELFELIVLVDRVINAKEYRNEEKQKEDKRARERSKMSYEDKQRENNRLMARAWGNRW